MRPTHEEIDLGIINTAASLFAAQGFERTSVQQIADAVGYSKTGLLHRFPSKQAILEAVDALLVDAIGQIQDYSDALADVPDRQHQLLTMIADSAVRLPGLVQYLMQDLNSLQPGEQGAAAQLHDLGDRIIESLAGPALPAERRLRVILALELICSGVVAARHPELTELDGRLGPLLVELAESVIADEPADRSTSAAPGSHPRTASIH